MTASISLFHFLKRMMPTRYLCVCFINRIKFMTKKELIEALADYPEDIEVKVEIYNLCDEYVLSDISRISEFAICEEPFGEPVLKSLCVILEEDEKC